MNRKRLFAGCFFATVLISATLGLLILSVSSQPPIHDVAVTKVSRFKTVVGQGLSAKINVTVQNNGNFSETFNTILWRLGGRVLRPGLTGRAALGWNNSIPGPTMTVNRYDDVLLPLTSGDGLTHNFYVDYNGNGVPDPGEPKSPNFQTTITFEFVAGLPGAFTYYCNFHQLTMFGTFNVNPTPTTAQIGAQQTSLTPGEQKTLTFTWNTTGVAKGNYTIGAVADTVLGETNIADNTLTNGGVTVAMVGDIIPDGVIDIFDLVTVASHFGHSPPDGHTLGSQAYFACFNADVIEDGIVDIFDLVTVASHFGQTDP